ARLLKTVQLLKTAVPGGLPRTVHYGTVLSPEIISNILERKWCSTDPESPPCPASTAGIYIVHKAAIASFSLFLKLNRCRKNGYRSVVESPHSGQQSKR
ncbi:unnamed protein product, partial [Ixodes pacificus]